MERTRLFRTVSIGEKEQVGKVQQISEERFYTIECRLNGFCLRSQPKTWRAGDALRVTGNLLEGNLLESNNLKQLWMFKRVSSSQWEIIHVKSDLVLTVEEFEGRLRVGRLEASQKFQVIPWKNGLVRLKDFSGAVLRLDGILEAAEFSERDEAQLFRLNGVGMFDVKGLKDTVFILTDDKGRSLDLVNASREDEKQIIVFRRNMRMNQRWRFVVTGAARGGQAKSVHLMSALTEQFVVVDRKAMGQVVVASYPEEWLVEETEIKEYVFLKHKKQEEYLSYGEDGQLFFTTTRKSKWYIQNVMEGLIKNSSIERTISI